MFCEKLSGFLGDFLHLISTIRLLQVIKNSRDFVKDLS